VCPGVRRPFRRCIFGFALALVLFAGTADLKAQSLANYTITRQTGITYNSISSTGNSIPAWRNSYQWIYDDNRSYPIPIGFDFWYDGIRYTNLSVSTNGFVDFSSSVADGSIGVDQTGRDYDSENWTVSSTTQYPSARGSWNVLAPMYYDLTTQNEQNPLGGSFKYLTTGVAPNRVFTVEFDSLSAWNQAGLGTALNFQVKLYETSGKIEFVYGNMIPGTATYAYSCTINGPNLSGGLTAANFQTLQSVNTATFSTTPQNSLSPPPASLSQLRFLPPAPLDPTTLTFTSVTTTAMTLNWTDNATNEIGYAIYQSSDGSNYAFITQLAAHAGTGAMSYTSTGLVPNTTYYWRIYAVTEGGVSNVLAGSQSTSGAPNDTSATSGLWSNPTTWKSGGVPTSITNVVIADGHSVTIDKNFTVNSLSIGMGTSGILRFGNDNTPRYDTVITGVTVNSGGTLDVSTSSNTNGHLLVVGGDLINNGTLNLATDADSKVRLEFNKNGSQVINGSGGLTKVYRMTLNIGSSSNNILDIFPPSFTADTSNFVTINNGTLRFSTSATMTPFAGNAQIPANGGLWLNNSSANITVTDSLGVAGLLRVTSGSLTVGTTANGNLRSGGGTFVFEGGTTTVAGRFDARDITTITNFQMTAGTLTVNTNGSVYTYAAPFSMQVVGSTFTMTGGTIIIQRQGGNNLGYVNTGASASHTVSGGTIQIGNGSTPGTDVIKILSTIPLYNLSIVAATGLADGDLTVLHNVAINNTTTLDGSTRTLSVAGNWNNSGAFTHGTSTVVFNGAAQTISRTGGENFNNLTLNSTGNVTMNNNVIVSGALTLTQGTLAVGANTLELDGAVSATSGALTSTNTGTVYYNQGSNGQSVLAANYGNLTFSNFNKVLASSGSIGIAGVFTQGSGVGHTNTGSTINYNSGGAQAVAPFTYRNLVLSNGGVKTASGASTVQGDLTISSGLTLADGGFNIAVNGNVSNASLHTSTGAGALTLTGGGAAHTLSGGGSFGNLTMNDANGATLSGSVTVNGTLTFTSGVITAANDTVMVSSSGTVARTSGHVNGWLRKYIPSGTPTPTFEIGTAATYLPVTLQFASVTTPGTLALKNTTGDHPQLSSSMIDPANSVNRYWTLFSNQIVFTTADITFNWINPTDQDNPGAFAGYQVSTYANSTWQQDASSNQAASNIKATSIAGFGDFAVGAGAASNAYRTKASGDWSDYNTVWEVYNGSTWVAASKSPQLADGAITIENGHSITVTTNLSGGTNGIDQLVIQSTGRIDVNTGGTLEIRNATAPGMTASGILSVNGGTFTTNGAPTITFANGSKYIHNQNGGTIPTATYGATSTVEIAGVTTTVPTGLAQTFGNFVWNSSGQTTNINLAGDPATVSSDFVVASTGTAELLLNDNTAAAKSIGGRFDVRGGRVIAKTVGNTAYGITVADSLSLTGGRLTFLRGNGTGAVTVTISGHVLVATTATDTLDLSSSSANASGTLNVAKNFIHNSGVISQSGGGTAAGNIIFNGTTPQTFSSTGNFSNRLNFNLNAGTTVNMGTSVAAGVGTFTVAAGANLGIGSLQGISAAGATGNVQTTTRTFNVAANYIYNGAGAQITGNGLPATVNKLILTNASGVQLSSTVAVTDSLQLLSGLFDIQTNSLTLNNVVYRTSGSLTSATTGTVSYNKASNGQVVIGAQYGNLTFSNFNKTFPSSPADVVKIAGTFTAGSALGHTLTGSSVDFNGASQTIPVLPYNNLRASGSGTAVLAGNTSVAGALDISGVTLSDGSFNLTANGNVNNSGTHTGTGRIVLSGSASTRTLTGGGSYANLEINDVNGVNFSGNIVINGTLILTNGLFTSATDTVIVNTPSAGVSKSGNLSHVNAKMKKLVPVNASPQTFTFEVGDATTYAPANLTVLSASTAGSITLSTVGSDHPQIATSGINPSKSVNRYWTIGKIGLVLSSYNATFNYVSGDIDAGANSSVFVVKKYNSVWSRTTTGSRTSTSTQSLGLTTFEDFIVGEVSPIVYWNRGGGTSSWKNPLNWSTQEVPFLTSTAVLNIADTVAVDTAVLCKTIMIQNSGMRVAAQAGFVVKATDTLYLQQGTLHIQTTRFDSIGTMQITGGTVAYDLSSGNQIVKAFTYKNLTISGGGTKSAAAAFTVLDTLRIVAGAILNDSASTITVNKDIYNSGTHSGSGKILLTGGSANHIVSGGGSFTNLELNDALGATLGGTMTSSGNLTITSGAFSDNGFQITGNGTGTLSVAAGTGLNLGSAVVSTSFPTNFTAPHISLNAASLVTYKSGTAQVVSAVPTYGNLTIAGAVDTSAANYKTAAAALTVSGVLTINAGNTLDMQSFSGSTFGVGASNNGKIRWSADNIYVAGAGTTEFYSSVAGNFAAGLSYGNVFVSGTNKSIGSGVSVSASGGTALFGVTVTGGLSIAPTGSLTITGMNLNLNGPIANNGSVTVQ
jgi:hypothetical protein